MFCLFIACLASDGRVKPAKFSESFESEHLGFEQLMDRARLVARQKPKSEQHRTLGTFS
jgi:hypothetical protein